MPDLLIIQLVFRPLSLRRAMSLSDASTFSCGGSDDLLLWAARESDLTRGWHTGGGILLDVVDFFVPVMVVELNNFTVPRLS